MKPKILVFDVETAPIIADVWGLWEQNVGLNQIVKDWHLLSWAAKWFTGRDGTVYGPHSRMMYMDQRNAKRIEDDSKIVKGLWRLLDEADYVITQNGDSFDIKKVNTRFLLLGLKPPSPFKSIDNKKVAKRKFAFTSNRLEYLGQTVNKKHRKLKSKKFIGHDLWTACRDRNLAAWKEMERYNKNDVLSTEENYQWFQPWDNSINLNLFTESLTPKCSCGSTRFKENGHSYERAGVYKRYKCLGCGAPFKSKTNLLDKDKRKAMLVRA